MRSLRYTTVLLVLTAHIALGAASARVALVQGTSSMPNATESRYGVSVTQRLSRWLSAIPIAHTTLTDDSLSTATLRGINVLILGYNPTPLPATLRTLEAFVNRGGKLIVCYSAAPKLAQLMGMDLGKYYGAQGSTFWTSMQFHSRKHGDPARIVQSSRSMRPVYPKSHSAHILAEWNTEKGKPSGLPAVVESSRGIWITHVLLDDGDVRNKQRFLLSSIGRYVPEVWPAAARFALQHCTRIGNISTAQSWDALHKQIFVKGAPKQAHQYWEQATATHRKAKQEYAAKHYVSTISLCDSTRETLIKAVACSQPSRPGELRGVWEHSGLGLYPGDWDRTCKLLRKTGVTDLYVNLLWPGQAHYPSRIVPHSRAYGDYGDQALACTKAGRRHGIRIHAWKVCWNLDGAPASFMATLKKAGRLQVTSAGETIPWLCPSRADNVKYEVDAIREVIERYPVAGIHLDYIRYRDSNVCCCDGCRKRFAQDTGLTLSEWPADLQKKSVRKKFDQWRCGRITHLVSQVHDAIKETAPAVQLTAAVYGRYPLCKASVAQDWHLWLERDYVDAVCPMNYTADPNSFKRWLDEQTALSGSKGRLLPGIGVTAKDCDLDPIQVMAQIQEIRRRGLPGYLLFDLNQTLATETLPALALGSSKESH